jgi:hypothetical protein
MKPGSSQLHGIAAAAALVALLLPIDRFQGSPNSQQCTPSAIDAHAVRGEPWTYAGGRALQCVVRK